MRLKLPYIIAAALCLLGSFAIAQQSAPDAAKIEQLTGAKGKMNDKEGVFKVSMPRSDLQ